MLACAEKAGLIPLDMAEPLKPLMVNPGIDAMFRSLTITRLRAIERPPRRSCRNSAATVC